MLALSWAFGDLSSANVETYAPKQSISLLKLSQVEAAHMKLQQNNYVDKCAHKGMFTHVAWRGGILCNTTCIELTLHLAIYALPLRKASIHA